MATIKKRKGKKKEKDSNSLVPLKDNTPKIEDTKNGANTTAIEENKSQQNIRTVFIPEETIIVEEGRFDKLNFIIQTSLAFIALSTLFGFIYFYGLQHRDSVNALALAQRNSDSSNVATKKSIAIAESSNVLTRQSLEIAQRNFEIEDRPYLSIKGIDNLIIKGHLAANVQAINVGKSPAYDIRPLGAMKIRGTGVFDVDWKTVESDRTQESNTAESGLPFSEINLDKRPLTLQDSIEIFNGRCKWFAFGIFWYKDVFDKPHWTRYCVVYDTTVAQFTTYIHYNESDRYGKNQPSKHDFPPVPNSSP
jgi:hypothetical protein